MNQDGKLQISTIIPTLNRLDLLKDTIESIVKQSIKPSELIIVDQSDNDMIRNWFKEIGLPFEKKYIYLDIKSLTAARNTGVKYAVYDIVSFLDDDVLLHKKYYQQILEIFSSYPSAKGVSGYITNYHLGHRFLNKLKRLARLIFLLNYNRRNSCKLFHAYGTSYPDPLTRVINCQWLCGANTNWRKEIFEEFTFDEKLTGYSFMEDVDFSYRVYSKYKYGLFLTPKARIIHRKSGGTSGKKLGVRYIDHKYAQYLYFKNFGCSFFYKCIYNIQKSGIILLEYFQNIVKE